MSVWPSVTKFMAVDLSLDRFILNYVVAGLVLLENFLFKNLSKISSIKERKNRCLSLQYILKVINPIRKNTFFPSPQNSSVYNQTKGS